MDNAVTRRCYGCENPIIFTENTTGGIVLHKNRYYHKECFIEMATRKAANKRSLPLWQEALDSIDTLEAKAIQLLQEQFVKDELNRHLLNYYGVVAVPSSFWTTVSELGNGSYRRKQCKPVSIETLLGAWRWGQRNLDKIAIQNQMNNAGPQNGEDRLRYDLAILIGKIPMYLREKAKEEAAKAHEQPRDVLKINYNHLQQKQTDKKEGLDDISDLLEEVF